MLRDPAPRRPVAVGQQWDTRVQGAGCEVLGQLQPHRGLGHKSRAGDQLLDLAADVRGEVEQLIARTGLVAQAAVRLELAEDLTARALNACVPLLTHRDGSPWRGVPEHVRALTSPAVIEVEADITSAMIARAQECPVRADLEPVAWLDVAQREVVAALAGTGTLLVVEGAAGAGKTTTLAAPSTTSRVPVPARAA